MRRLLPIIVVLAAFAFATDATDSLTTTVTLMARIGRCTMPQFSPDGKTLAFRSDMSGVPQVWTVPVEGGWPRQITALDDPVDELEWSPTSDWLALSVAPGGGMNTQIYVVRSDGTGLRRLTRGGKEDNWLASWTHDGSALMMSSNLRDGAAMDSYLLQFPDGKMKVVAQNPGVGEMEDVTRDGRYALVSRMADRGSNDVYLIEVANGKAANLTPHEGPGDFGGEFSRDGQTVYLASNKDRDLKVFAKVKLGPNGEPGPIQVLAARDDAELDGFGLNDQGTLAVLLWNAGGRSELYSSTWQRRRCRPAPLFPPR